MSRIDPRLSAFISQCDAVGRRLGVRRSTLSTKLFKDGKRIDALAAGGSDVGIGRLAQAESDLAALDEAAARARGA